MEDRLRPTEDDLIEAGDNSCPCFDSDVNQCYNGHRTGKYCTNQRHLEMHCFSEEEDKSLEVISDPAIAEILRNEEDD